MFIYSYIYICFIELITYGNVTYLSKSAQRSWMGGKLYWTKDMTPDGNSNPQDQVKKARHGK